MLLYGGWEVLGRGDRTQSSRVGGSDGYACVDGGRRLWTLMSVFSMIWHIQTTVPFVI
jgi:hypothetical protein